MARGSSKFSRKYSMFLADASDEEVVSISKELAGEMALQVRSLNTVAVSLLAVSSVALLLAVYLISLVDGPVTSFNTLIMFLRFGSLSMMCLAALFGALSLGKALRASSMSTLMWRNVRETATDETVYEQRMSVEKLNRLLFTARNDIWVSSLLMVLGSVVLGMTYAVEMFSSMGYI